VDEGAEENVVEVPEESGSRKDECRLEMSLERNFAGELPAIIDNIVELHDKGTRFSHIGPEPMPARSSVVEILDRVIRLLYPGYFSPARLIEVNVPYYFGQQVARFSTGSFVFFIRDISLRRALLKSTFHTISDSR